MDGNGIGQFPGQIVIECVPTGAPGHYRLEMAYQQIEGGWPTVFGLLLGALGYVAQQLVPGQPVAQSPVFQAMCNVFKAFLQGLCAPQEQAPRIERVQELPPTMPSVKEWFKN